MELGSCETMIGNVVIYIYIYMSKFCDKKYKTVMQKVFGSFCGHIVSESRLGLNCTVIINENYFSVFQAQGKFCSLH